MVADAGSSSANRITSLNVHIYISVGNSLGSVITRESRVIPSWTCRKAEISKPKNKVGKRYGEKGKFKAETEKRILLDVARNESDEAEEKARKAVIPSKISNNSAGRCKVVETHVIHSDH